MPYLKQADRDKLDSGVLVLANPGELNYAFTREINDYLETKGLSYQTINDIVGALEGAKLEFYRRVAAPYETMKWGENGDVYTQATWGQGKGWESA